MANTPTPNSATPLQTPTSSATDYQAQEFFVKQMIERRIRTSILVQVQAVHGGGVGASPTVDVLPMVHQIDGAGNVVPHETIYNRPVHRIQGGTNAIIVDPQVNDIGWMCFAQRDISAVISSKKPSPPGSRRKFSFADGVYFGSFLGATPTQYVLLNSSGVTIDATAADINAPTNIVGATNINGATIALTGAAVFPLSVAATVDVTSDEGANSLNAIALTVSGLTVSVGAISSAKVLLQTASAAFPSGYVLTAGTNITLTPGSGTLTISASGGGGGSLSVTDGTNTETSVTTLTVSGLSVSSTGAGNATVSANITPATHPITPTAWDDEFEFGTSLDTTGARRTGANPWRVRVAAGTYSTAILRGCLMATFGTGNVNSNTVFSQTLSGAGATWAFETMKPSYDPQSFSGMFVGLDASGKGYYFGYFSGTIFVEQMTAYNVGSPSTAASTGWYGSSSNIVGIPLCLKISYDGTNINFYFSGDGLIYNRLYSVTPASYIGSLPDSIGLMGGQGAPAPSNNLNFAVAHDYFRKTA